MAGIKNRIAYYDVLNVVSCISVVCLHCNGYVHYFIKDDWWWFRVLIEVICYFAVPVFFMLSGATLLNYRERYSTTAFYKKRFLRTLIPFLFWGCLFYGLYLVNHFNEKIQWTVVFKNFAEGNIPYTAFWFFVPLFLLYIFMPFLSLMVTNMSKRLLMYLCILLIFFQSLLPTIYTLLGVNISMSLPIAGYFVFALLGYYISISRIEYNNVFYWVVSILAIVVMIIRYILIYLSEEKVSSLFTYFGLYSILPAIFVFLTAKRYIQNIEVSPKWAFLSKKSLGVYVIHMFIISILLKIINNHTPWIVIFLIPFVYSISITITSLFQKNKYCSYLFP